VLRIDGLRDGRGRSVPPLESRFVSGPIAFGDIGDAGTAG
jgi:hypothetical protein